jgi:hypothetical protein
MYGAGRYVDYSLISKGVFNHSSKNEAYLSPQSQTSGNIQFEYLDFDCSLSLGGVSMTQMIPFFYDMVTQQLGESVYYVYDPVLSRLYFNNSENVPYLKTSGFAEFSMNLVLYPSLLVSDLYVSAIRLKIVATNGETISFSKPVALKQDSMEVLDSNGVFQYSVNNLPVTNANTAPNQNLPNVACLWNLPNLTPLTIGQRYVSKEIYNICLLKDFNYTPLGYPGIYEDTNPTQVDDVNNVRRDRVTLLDQFNKLIAKGPSNFCDAPGSKYDPDFFINNRNLLNVTPYSSANGAILEKAGSGAAVAVANYDFESGANFLIDAELSFSTYRVQLPGFTFS